MTEGFRNIRMPIGTGILGIVAATNRPAWTDDHAEDPQVSHVEYVDEAVEAEGIRGILGAPIRISGKTVGALLVGDRHPHCPGGSARAWRHRKAWAQGYMSHAFS